MGVDFRSRLDPEEPCGICGLRCRAPRLGFEDFALLDQHVENLLSALLRFGECTQSR